MKRSQAPSRTGFNVPRAAGTTTPLHKTEPIPKKMKTDLEGSKSTDDSPQNTENESTPKLKGDRLIQ
jgi:hypothetical protein